MDLRFEKDLLHRFFLFVDAFYDLPLPPHKAASLCPWKPLPKSRCRKGGSPSHRVRPSGQEYRSETVNIDTLSPIRCTGGVGGKEVEFHPYIDKTWRITISSFVVDSTL